jgi:benzylsuccinate CoA-transferase BbsF subunit
MTALMHRLRTGQGQFIDVSQTQAAAATIPETLLDFSANGRTPTRIGNADPVMAPHGCYPCAGEDRWIVIAVSEDVEWRGLCEVLRQSDWLGDGRFSSGPGRLQNREVLDQMVADATISWDAHRLMQALQAAGVPAGSVLDSKDLLFNDHLRARGFYEIVRHHPNTGMPPLPYASRPWKLSETPAVSPKAAPLMGEHNYFVLKDLLGLPESDVTRLEEEGVIGFAPDDPRPVRRPSLEEQVRQGRMLRYESDFQEKVSQSFPLPPTE